MQGKSSDHSDNLLFRATDFIIHTNIFISLCSASLSAWSTRFFLGAIDWSFVSVAFCSTLLLYNGQRMYLSFFRERKYSFKDWYYKNKYAILFLMLVSLGGLYPLIHISWRNLLVFFASFLLGIFYFLPFSNLRTIPVVKSMTVGLVWVLVCVVAPLEHVPLSKSLLAFCFMQLIFISALCVLFNIRDVEEDTRSGTHSLPVLFGISRARQFVYGAMLFYIGLSWIVNTSLPFLSVTVFTFIATLLFTYYAALERHSFYYGLGVDGLILMESLLGLFLT